MGYRSRLNEYLLAMAIGSLTIEKVQELCAERDKLNKEVDDLRKETPKSKVPLEERSSCSGGATRCMTEKLTIPCDDLFIFMSS